MDREGLQEKSPSCLFQSPLIPGNLNAEIFLLEALNASVCVRVPHSCTGKSCVSLYCHTGTLDKADIRCSGLLDVCAMCSDTFQCLQYYKLLTADFLESCLTVLGSLLQSNEISGYKMSHVRNFQFISNKFHCKRSTCRPWFLLMQITFFCGFPLRLCL